MTFDTYQMIFLINDFKIKFRTLSYLNPFYWLGSNSNPIEEIEKNMLKSIKTPINRYYVHIQNETQRIWTMSANTDNKNTPIVSIHGFYSGIAFWVHNVDALSESRPYYAFDLIGFARSSRPKFSDDPIIAEEQFIDSIEDWRKQLNLKEIILLGHSFGGYISTAYALKYPKSVKALILVDPWGFPDPRESKRHKSPPLWVNFVGKLSRYISPLSFFRVTGSVGVSLFKFLRPDFMKNYMNVLENPEIVYSYLYHANNFIPKLVIFL